MKQIEKTFESMNVKIIEDVDKIKWMNANDVARVLEYKNPVVSSNDFINSNFELLEGSIRKFLIGGKGDKKGSWFLNSKGVIAFLIKSNSKKAIAFQKWAVNILDSELQNKQIEKEKTLRIKSKQIRNYFTEALKNHGISKRHEYIQLTYQTKINLDIDKNKKKNDCDLFELCKISMAETLSMYEIESKNKIGFPEIKPVIIDSAKTVNQLDLLEDK
jgi:prophage antirepressor-like protein